MHPTVGTAGTIPALNPHSRRNAGATVNMLLFLLERRDAVAAVDRLRSGYGLWVVK
jgi:hypothetical protein